MKVGLYFGSFNPIHHGHLIISRFILDHTDLNQVWFVVSPQNPLKPANTLLNEYHRLYLVQISIEGEPGLKASDVEFALPRPSYTSQTLAFLTEKYPGYQFSVIMGSDSYQNIHRWRNHEYILNNYQLYIYLRPSTTIPTPSANHRIEILQAPMLEISATHIRNLVQQRKSIRYLVPDKVKEEIERNGYYRN